MEYSLGIFRIPNGMIGLLLETNYAVHRDLEKVTPSKN